MSCANQFFRVGGRLALFKTRLEGIRTLEGAAPDFQRSTSLREISLPFSFCFSCWHDVLSIGYWILWMIAGFQVGHKEQNSQNGIDHRNAECDTRDSML